jgi:hypothetical protein
MVLTRMTRRIAVLWITHVWSPELETAFKALLHLRNAPNTDVWLLLDEITPDANAVAARYKRHHFFSESRLFNLSYPRILGRGLIYQAHFQILDFYLTHPEYDYFWVIEYDVRFTGVWGQFFTSFEHFDHDLITAHIRRYGKEYRWYWWSTLRHPSKVIPRERYLRSLNVIFRLSRRALDFLHDAQTGGWQGHPEVTIPTLLSEAGFRLLDMGGNGEFTLPGFHNRFYTSSATASGRFSPFCTIRDRPARARSGRSPNKLYHPVKPPHMLEPWTEHVRLALLYIRSLGKDAYDLLTCRTSGTH